MPPGRPIGSGNGMSNTNSRASVLARFIRRVPIFDDVQGVGIFVDDGHEAPCMLLTFSSDECRGDPMQLADSICETLQQQADELQVAVVATCHWLRGDGPDFTRYLAHKLKLWPSRDAAPDVGPSPMDGSLATAAQQSQRHLEALMKLWVMKGQSDLTREEKVLAQQVAASEAMARTFQGIVDLQQKQIERLEGRLFRTEEGAEESEATIEALTEAVTEAGEALEAAKDTIEQQANQDDDKVVNILVKQFTAGLMTAGGGGK